MISRSNVYLAILLGLQVVLLAALVLSSGGGETRPVEPIVRDLSADDVQRLSVASGADDELVFARKDTGWVLPKADDFPVNGEKVDEMLGKLLGLDTSRLVASNPVNFARLEVKDDDYRRRIELSGGASSALIYLGGSGGVDTVYTRRADENEVYLGRGLNAWELSAQAATWLDANYVSIPQADVQAIQIENAIGSLSLVRDGENWTLADLREGELFEDTRLPGMLRNAATIRLVEPLGLTAQAAWGMDAPRVTITLRYRQLLPAEQDSNAETEESDRDTAAEIQYSDETLILTFGAALEDGTIALKSSESDYFVSARDTVFNAFGELERGDFIKLPESDSSE